MANKTTLSEQIAEIKRELAMRKKVYPDWKRTGRIHPKEADHRIQVLEDLLERLEGLPGKQGGLF
ncbi:hypothetical protein [Arundinibacter roseus]|uniref:Uncharacterized protein n=1 Tax=Arundinibacter roseus TaxID=2070510 RepID=A0A4R4K9I7_9BACT|nr:hypothetical protein [Arundinibacter roseus]TDB64388.1 hypothetical protein EZE20_11945 [Arundinibacter roseus]